jgi:hypothetical protein
MTGTFEPSHGKVRLVGPRLSALGTVPTGEDRRRNHTAAGTFAPGNDAARERASKAGMRRPYRQARKRVHEALASGVDPSEADALLTDAFAVYLTVRRELGAGSAFIEGPAIFYAAESILAGYYMRAAADAGFLTELGMQLHDRALACEQAAARAMTAALAAAKALGGKKKPKNAILAAIDAAGEAAE